MAGGKLQSRWDWPQGEDALVGGRRSQKFVQTTALILTFSPQEKERVSEVHDGANATGTAQL